MIYNDILFSLFFNYLLFFKMERYRTELHEPISLEKVSPEWGGAK